VFVANAQKKHKKDIETIKEMCGCYEVTFNFAETFNYSKDSLYKPSKIKLAKAIEWAGLVVDEKNEISIQHILQIGNPNDPMVVKHWRQDWLFENKEFYMYDGDNSWSYQVKNKDEVKGQWTQKVYQVDDSPRYEGSGTWVYVDGKRYWESSTTAPLPRREYTKRNDYNITLRSNRVEMTENGWIHDQDNKKINRNKDGNDSVLAEEKGYNTYVKIEDSRCGVASSWWRKNGSKWEIVREKWSDIYKRNQHLNLKSKVNNKPLYKHLFDDAIVDEKQIDPIIESFVKKDLIE